LSNHELILSDIKWSFSKLNLFETCRYAFYQQYILERKGVMNAFAQFGSCSHIVLEKYAKGQLEIFELLNEYKEIYDTIVTEKFPRNKYKDLNQSYYEAGYQYFQEFEGFGDNKILGVEKEVSFKIEDYRFGGYIDLVLEDKNSDIIVVDHKSKSKMSGEEKDKYLKQLYLYCIPLIEEYKKYPKYLKFNMIRYQDWITEEFNVDKLEETKNWAINIIETIFKEEKFLPYSSKYFCSNICSFRNGICEYIPN
jgi:hypothetical protein